jgi:proline iminopeptidase
MTRIIDETHAVAAPDADLYVELAGPEGAPAVYYLHGGPGYNSYSFRDTAGDELTHHLMIYADQRGDGRSSGGPADLETLADDVATVLDALELPHASLLAHGFGALIATHVAARHPKRVGKLLLVNPWVDMPLLARTLQREAAVQSGNTDLALPPEQAIGEDEPNPEDLLEQAFGWLSPKRLLDDMQFPKTSSRLRLEHSDAEAMIGSSAGENLRGFWSWSARPLLASLEHRTVVVGAQHDRSSYPDQVEVVLEGMPQALFSLLDAGHYPWLDDPEGFFGLLNEALALPDEVP